LPICSDLLHLLWHDEEICPFFLHIEHCNLQCLMIWPTWPHPLHVIFCISHCSDECPFLLHNPHFTLQYRVEWPNWPHVLHLWIIRHVWVLWPGIRQFLHVRVFDEDVINLHNSIWFWHISFCDSKVLFLFFNTFFQKL